MTDDLIIEALRVEAQGTRLIADISARFAPGQLTAIVGPNGAGKSTLLRAMAGVVPTQGTIRMGTADLTALRPAERARRLAYLPQVHELAWDISVADMVALGRFSYGAAPGRLSAEDKAAVDRAMAATGCTDLAHRGVTSLSGGEAALACLARVLAAETPVLLVDEPVAALDPANQYRVMECLASLAADGRTVVAVLHDLSLVAQFADTLMWLVSGAMVAQTSTTREAFIKHVPEVFSITPSFANESCKTIYFSERAEIR